MANIHSAPSFLVPNGTVDFVWLSNPFKWSCVWEEAAPSPNPGAGLDCLSQLCPSLSLSDAFISGMTISSILVNEIWSLRETSRKAVLAREKKYN